jgi:hypothetical protein
MSHTLSCQEGTTSYVGRWQETALCLLLLLNMIEIDDYMIPYSVRRHDGLNCKFPSRSYGIFPFLAFPPRTCHRQAWVLAWTVGTEKSQVRCDHYDQVLQNDSNRSGGIKYFQFSRP